MRNTRGRPQRAPAASGTEHVQCNGVDRLIAGLVDDTSSAARAVAVVTVAVGRVKEVPLSEVKDDLSKYLR
jgi:hypothetical protein